MMDMPEKKQIVGVNKESIGRPVTIDATDLFGARVVQVGSPDTIRSIDIGLHVWIDDYMRAYVEKYHSYMYYDQCLHGHNYFGIEKCTCPIKQPYIAEHFFEARAFFKGRGYGYWVEKTDGTAYLLISDRVLPEKGI